jgi:hypothetical protein
MAEELTTTAFKIPNREGLAKTSGGIFKLALIGAAGLAAYIWLLPFLLTIVWGSVELVAGLAILGILGWFFSKPKVWRAINYFTQFAAEKLLSIAIEMNPWAVMNNQLDKAEEDREDMHKKAIALMGQQAKIKDEMADYNNQMRSSQKQVDIVKKAIATETNPDKLRELNRQWKIQSSTYVAAKDYIDSVQPTLNGINKTVDFLGNAYDESGDVIQIYRNKIKVEKAKWDAITTGSAAMASAQLAFEGRPQLNEDSLKAMNFIRTDMGNKLGAMKESLKIASRIMDGKDLADAAKIQEATESMDQFRLNNNFKYSDTIQDDDMAVAGTIEPGNKFLKLLK